MFSLVAFTLGEKALNLCIKHLGSFPIWEELLKDLAFVFLLFGGVSLSFTANILSQVF